MFSEGKKQQSKKNNPEEIFAADSGFQIKPASNWDAHPLPVPGSSRGYSGAI
jgi:hypothetical protein